jgi:ubiquinone/menaquinone biosynthesis C-methylase UbiE
MYRITGIKDIRYNMNMDSEEKQKKGIFDTKHAPMLDAGWRVRELQPEQLIQEIIKVRAGEACVDLGCGTGTFALWMAEAAGEKGMVYAIDNSERMLEIIKEKDPPPQLIPVLADVMHTGLDDGIADVCLLAFILHEVENQVKLITEACRLLKSGGRIAVLEWRADADMPMPPKHRRITQQKIEELFRQAGLTSSDYVERTDMHYAAIGVKHGR